MYCGNRKLKTLKYASEISKDLVSISFIFMYFYQAPPERKGVFSNTFQTDIQTIFSPMSLGNTLIYQKCEIFIEMRVLK